MSISCNDLFEYAQKLAELGEAEVEYRAAISRAYYAAFHYAAQFYKQVYGVDLPQERGMGMHKTLINYLKNPECEEKELRDKSKNLGEKLQKVMLTRINADYKITWQIPKSIALMHLAEVRRILSIQY